MTSGRVVHGRVVARIRSAEETVDALTGEVEELEAELAELGERREAAFRALAEIHLPEMTAESVAGTLAGMRERLGAILTRKEERRRDLGELVPAARAEVVSVEGDLDQLLAELNRLGEERERLEGLVLEELSGDPEWRSLTERARRARSRVEAAERRRETALEERKEKTPAYDRDPFFSYLHRRRVGTPEAAGNALTRSLDAWVAESVDYGEARRDYEVLLALPEHAAARLEEEREALEAVAGPLGALRDAAAERHGLTSVLRQGDSVYAAREEALDALAEAEERHRALAAERASLDDDRGRYFEEALGELQAFLDGRTPGELVETARATDDPRDDELVEELAGIDGRMEAAAAELSRARMDRSRALEQVEDLRKLRRYFERSDWNGRRSEFRDDVEVDALLLGYIQGRHSVTHVRQRLGRAQHFRAHDSGGGFFTGGGFSGGGTSGGGSSGGGFSTGGGFSGGGGFSTGGGF